MQESSIVQYFTEKSFEQGMEQGKQQHAVAAVLTVLEVRFQNDVAKKLKPFLGAIDDLERLDQLHRVAARASNIDEFTHALLNLEDWSAFASTPEEEVIRDFEEALAEVRRERAWQLI